MERFQVRLCTKKRACVNEICFHSHRRTLNTHTSIEQAFECKRTKDHFMFTRHEWRGYNVHTRTVPETKKTPNRLRRGINSFDGLSSTTSTLLNLCWIYFALAPGRTKHASFSPPHTHTQNFRIKCIYWRWTS